MSYVKQILFPDEKVLYFGKVHPRVLLHGIILMLCDYIIYHFSIGTGGGYSPVMSVMRGFGEGGGFLGGIYHVLEGWQRSAPEVAMEFKLISLSFGVWGLKRFIQAALLMYTTELVVTTERIIAKMGVLNVATLEMDKRRVAEILIDQSFWGRMLNYGHIYIRGFTGVIGGMPVMMNPRQIERHIMRA